MKPVTAGASAPVQILDCTLRDGGYYNDWDYAFDLVSRYVEAMAAARIDVCELGFRTLATDKYLGATAFTTDEFIDAVNVPASLQLAVMLNAKEINAAADPRVTLRRHFAPRSRSKVSLVRIAATVNEVDALGPAIDELRDLGYDVALNLMQVTDRPLADVTAFGRKAKSFGSKYAYVADSFGSLRPSGVRPIISALIDGFGPEVGCHLHDNMSYALANTMEAVNAGVVIADATVQGMGRGPGNVRTEYLVMELAALCAAPTSGDRTSTTSCRRTAPSTRRTSWNSRRTIVTRRPRSSAPSTNSASVVRRTSTSAGSRRPSKDHRCGTRVERTSPAGAPLAKFCSSATVPRRGPSAPRSRCSFAVTHRSSSASTRTYRSIPLFSTPSSCAIPNAPSWMRWPSLS
jgi:hypothetical protein